MDNRQPAAAAAGAGLLAAFSPEPDLALEPELSLVDELQSLEEEPLVEPAGFLPDSRLSVR